MIRADHLPADVEPARAASPRRHGELIRAAERELRFAQPAPVWAWLGSLAGAAVIGMGLGGLLIFLVDVVA